MAKFLDKTGLDTFWAKIKSTFQTLGNLVTSWGSIPSDSKYPSEKLVKNSLDEKASDSSVFHTSDVIPVANGGTGKSSITSGNFLVGNGTAALDDKTPKATEYAVTTGKSVISDTTSGDDKVMFGLATPSESNGVTRGFRTLSTIWAWIKGLLSSESGVNISGNAATATKATQDSDGNAINATYFKSSGNTTLVSGSDTKIGTQNGADVKLTLPTIPSGSQLVYDCGTGSISTTDFSNALAAYTAGKWVIIKKDGVVYHCVGTFNSGLRFKAFANESDLLKVRTLIWMSGSAPTAGTQLEASLSGHTHSQYLPVEGKAASAAKVEWSAATASTERPVGFANSGNSSSYSQDLNFDSEIIYDKDFAYKPSGSGNGASTLTVKNTKSSSGNEAAIIAKADVAGSAIWLDSTATGGSHKRGLWAPASSVSGDSGKWIIYNDYVNQRNNSGGWEFIGTSANARYAYHDYYIGGGTANWIKIGRVYSPASNASAGGALTAIISSGYNTSAGDLSAQIIRVSIRSKGTSTNGVYIVGDNVTLGLKNAVVGGDARFAVHTVTARTTSVDGVYDIYVEQKGYQHVDVLPLHNDNVEMTFNSNDTKVLSDTTNMTIFSPTLPYAGNSESAKELRIPYGSGSAYLQIGVSGSYLALGTNLADGVMVSYAGQASQAAVAGMLGTTSVGGADNPIYLNNGVPTACNWWVS